MNKSLREKIAYKQIQQIPVGFKYAMFPIFNVYSFIKIKEYLWTLERFPIKCHWIILQLLG